MQQFEVTHQEAFDAFGDLFDVVLVWHGSSVKSSGRKSVL